MNVSKFRAETSLISKGGTSTKETSIAVPQSEAVDNEQKKIHKSNLFVKPMMVSDFSKMQTSNKLRVV